MRLNDIHPGKGAKRVAKRRGRGAGSGLGKTGGRGQKGQRSRSGGSIPRGFEGGQMPLQRRLPKFGFTSRKSRYNDEIRLDQLSAVDAQIIDIDTLKAARLVSQIAKRVKIIASGEIGRPVTTRGLVATKGARSAIETAGGRIEE